MQERAETFGVCVMFCAACGPCRATRSYIIQQLAFATYKSSDPDATVALLESKTILIPLDPHASSDPETLGLWGAIHKRLYEMKELSAQDHVEALTAAIRAYQKGFYLKDDYYNGI